jgi:hypothetical protein
MKAALLASCLLVSACSSEGERPRTSITLSQLPTGTSTSARAVIWLWGYSSSLADARASLIEAYALPIEPGMPVAVEIPANPHEMIDQGHGPVSAADARFYFSVYVDVDGDGQLCPGELRQDFELSPWASFATPPTSIDVALTEIDANRPCEPIVPAI